jgi:predicted GH43/DUF377 family glycosyl hydrolase
MAIVLIARHQANPIVPVTRWTWRDEAVSAPCAIVAGDHVRLYYSARMGAHERIGLGLAPLAGFDPGALRDCVELNPLIDVGGVGDVDGMHARHASVVRHHDLWYCFYAGENGEGERAICAATSLDGIAWKKFVRNPLFSGDAPEALVWRDEFVLFFSRGRAIYRVDSRDGIRWSVADKPVLAPVPGAWDGFSVTSPRVFRSGALLCMLYGGDAEHENYPRAIGMAVSRDSITWRRTEGAPILRNGSPGEWDDGAVWPGRPVEINGMHYLFYEGCGKGAHGVEKGPPIVSPSQIGCASVAVSEWNMGVYEGDF